MLPSPSSLLGLEDTFTGWYPGQEQTFSHIADWLGSTKRFFCLAAPTGSGKSLLAALASKMSGKRTVILTATKGLQRQIMDDFQELGMVDIRGQNSFLCLLGEETTLRADEGPCHEGMACDHRDSGCPYYMRLKEALGSNLVVTNYAYYLAQTRYAEGLGDIGLLVADETHLAGKALESHLAVYISREEVEPLGLSFPSKPLETWMEWKSWAAAVGERAAEETATLRAQIKTMQELGRPTPMALSKAYRAAGVLEKKAGQISTAFGLWVWEHRGHGWMFTPVDIGEYAHPLLFRDVEKVLAMSAVMAPKTAEGLRIGEEEREFMEAESYFPPGNSPVIHISTARINYRSTPQDMRLWVSRIDQVMDRRMDRKGILFTASYARRDLVLQKSRHSELMVSHSTGNVIEAVNRFRRMEPPALLVSPSVTSGWDFPSAECEYIIIGKLPYPDTSTPVAKARSEIDKDWTSFAAMETLVQESGRGTRGLDDKCEIIVLDDNWRWFWYRFKHFAPDWFKQRVRGSVSTVPNPPERIVA